MAGHPMKATNEQIIAAYRETGSVWRAAQQLGMVGQSVHERLRKLGYSLPGERWSEDELHELRQLVGVCTIGEIARRLGRPYGGTATKISQLGLAVGNYHGQQKIPRGVGLDKANVKKLVRELHSYKGTLSAFSRLHGLRIELFVVAAQKHFPEEWERYTREHAVAPPKACPYCGRDFYPMSGKQKVCSRECAGHQRSDKKHFGGNRRNTIGLAEGVCQLCGRTGRRLSSHHLVGKQNDPDNEFLIALCSGCHQMVGILAAHPWCEDTEKLEALIALALIRRTGAENGTGHPGFYTYVEIESLHGWEDDE